VNLRHAIVVGFAALGLMGGVIGTASASTPLPAKAQICTTNPNAVGCPGATPPPAGTDCNTGCATHN
jgi:hypothetical protein